MSDIDSAALATWAAVVVALGLALLDKGERRSRERAEGRVIATLLRPELERLDTAAAALKRRLGEVDKDGWAVEALAANGADFRRELAGEFEMLETATLASVVNRLHVMPTAASGALMEAFAEIERIRLAALVLAEMSDEQADRLAMDYVAELRKHVAQVAQRIAEARVQCRHVDQRKKQPR